MIFIFKNKKIFSCLLIVPIITSLILSSFAASPAYAQSLDDATLPVPTSSVNQDKKFVGLTVMGHSIPGTGWNAIYNLAMKTLLAHVTDSIVNWINSGFEGSPSFVTDPENFLVGVGDEVAGEFINGTEFGWLCDPYKLNVRIALSLGIGSFRRQRKCTLTAVIKNFDDFVTGTFKEGGWKGWFYLTTNPNAHPGTAFLTAQAELNKRMKQNEDMELKKLDWGRGFFSWRECEAYGASTESVNEDAKKGDQVFDNNGQAHNCTKWSSIKTPGTVIESQLEHTLGTSLRQMELADDIDKIVGALVSQLVTTVLQKGLTSLNSNDGWGGTSRDLDNMSSKTKINGTCTADTESALTGETVEWTVYTSGGSSKKEPLFKWSGTEISTNTETEDNFIRVVYNGPGAKRASVKVTKGNQTANIKCTGRVKVTTGDDSDTSGSGTDGYCSASKSTIKVGNSVKWNWTPYIANSYSGANYIWTDESGKVIDGAGNSKSFTIYYNDTGEKSANVMVTKGGESSNYDCGTVDVTDGKTSSGSSSSNNSDFCFAETTNALVNQTVKWSVALVNENESATYNWLSDDIDGPFGTTKNVYTRYTTTTKEGETKKASVEVTKNGATSTLTCVNSVVVNNSKLSASCGVYPIAGAVDTGDNDGTEFTWTAIASGGAGNYSYEWSGTDDLVGSEQSITTTYAESGNKTAQVTITSGTETITTNCGATQVFSE